MHSSPDGRPESSSDGPFEARRPKLATLRLLRLLLMMVAAGLFALLPAAGCDGTGPGGGPGSDDDDGDDDDNGDDDDSTVPLPPEPPGTPLRRLTNQEFNNTVRDLFPTVYIQPQELPAETFVGGFANNGDVQTPNTLLVEGIADAARRITEQLVPQQNLGCDGGDLEVPCARDYLADLLPRAFRRPVTDEELDTYHGLFVEVLDETHFFVAMQLTLQAVLQAPEFLYRVEFGDPWEGGGEPEEGDRVGLDGYEIATRLSYFLWASLPDAELFAAAAAGELSTDDQLRAQAERMLEDPRARTAIGQFHAQWLDVNEVGTLIKDHASWSPQLEESMVEETRRFSEHVIFESEGTLDELLTGRTVPVNQPLAQLYDVPAPNGDDWELRDLPADQRSGVLTSVAFLSRTGHQVHPSPVLRGAFVLERLLCSTPDPPPGDSDLTPPSDGGGTTNRERYEELTSAPECQACHAQINGIGFAFEGYDTVGFFRTDDNGQPVDDSGVLDGTDVDGDVQGAIELAAALATSDLVDRCYERTWYRYAIGRVERLFDVDDLNTIHDGFQAGDGEVQELLKAVVSSNMFRTRSAYIPAEDQ